MLKRSLGETGLTVSVVGLGAGSIGDPSQDERQIERLLHGAIERGVNLIDTARSYGLSEERIGRALRARRGEVVLSTKVGYMVEGVPDWTYDAVLGGVERARRSLGVDVVDVAHLHSCPMPVLQREEIRDALAEAKRRGWIRAAAYSGDNEELSWAVSSGSFDVVQCSFSLFDQVNGSAMAEAEKRGIGVIAKRSMGNAPWRFSERPAGRDEEEYWDRSNSLMLDRGALSWNELAIRFSAFAPGVSSAIIGTSRLEHLLEVADAVERGALDAESVATVERSFAARGSAWRAKI